MSIGQTSAEYAIRDPDVRLMLRVRDDDPAAFAEIVSLFQRRLVGVMTHVVGNAEEAEDLAQEVFLRVYRNRKKYSPSAKFSTWLFTIANNLALNALRNKGRRPMAPLAGSESGPLGARPEEQLAKALNASPSHGLRQAELADRVRAALDTLNERQRMAVVLNKFEDMNYAEVAEVMALTPKAVKSLLSRARARLRDALTGYIYMDGESVPDPADDDTDE